MSCICGCYYSTILNTSPRTSLIFKPWLRPCLEPWFANRFMGLIFHLNTWVALKRPFHLIGQNAPPSVGYEFFSPSGRRQYECGTDKCTLINLCLKPPLTVNYAQYLKQKYVAGHVIRAAAICKRPQSCDPQYMTDYFSMM